ncbi:hypothetical protein HMPREF9140_01728 [Prevotella micans F0438]|uniref:Uncharacterized protein n=1 Tax=Prevotella micans F0438 TaxID=883158 RepID=H1Q490_9BACT|nr:hypothetical protein HMPREF9140_01728 [Prevotella micans F0438]
MNERVGERTIRKSTKIAELAYCKIFLLKENVRNYLTIIFFPAWI